MYTIIASSNVSRIITTMSTLHPESTPPILWLLTDVLNLSISEIAYRTKLPRSTITSVAHYTPSDDTTNRLIQLAKRRRDELAFALGDVDPIAKAMWFNSPTFDRHRHHIFQLVTEVITFTNLKCRAVSRHRPRLIDHTKLTRRRAKITRALDKLLDPHPDGLSRQEVLAILKESVGAHPSDVFHAKRHLNVISTITGWGPTRRAVWRHAPFSPRHSKSERNPGEGLPPVSPDDYESPTPEAQIVNARALQAQRDAHARQREEEEIAQELARFRRPKS